MKKSRGESHNPRAHTEAAPEGREFGKLEQQYDSAWIEERDRLHPDFIQAIRTKHPGLVERPGERYAAAIPSKRRSAIP